MDGNNRGGTVSEVVDKEDNKDDQEQELSYQMKSNNGRSWPWGMHCSTDKKVHVSVDGRENNSRLIVDMICQNNSIPSTEFKGISSVSLIPIDLQRKQIQMKQDYWLQYERSSQREQNVSSADTCPQPDPGQRGDAEAGSMTDTAHCKYKGNIRRRCQQSFELIVLFTNLNL